MMVAMSLLGLDIGTSATKGVLLDDRGGVLAQVRRGYRLDVPAVGRAELAPSRVWTGVRRVILELAAIGGRTGSPVRAICAGGSGDEVVMVDQRGRPVAPVIMAIDQRSTADGAGLAAAGVDALARRTGLWDLAATPVARWRWVCREQPMLADRTAHLLSWPEWAMTRLGLAPVTDPTLAARTLGYDVTASGYAPDLPPGEALPLALLSPVVPTGDIAGTIPTPIAGRLGLPAGTHWVVGGFDQAMASLGAGVTGPGVAHDGIGSWEALSVRVPAEMIGSRELFGWSVGPSAAGGGLEAMTSWPGGSVLRWASSLVTGGVPSDRSLARALRDLPSGAPRLAATMALDPPAGAGLGGGAITGLDLASGHGDVMLAVMVGLAHRMRGATERLASAGVAVRLIRATGGGARSDRWLQARADATGIPVERPPVEQAGAYAAAVLAGSSIGLLPPPERMVGDVMRRARRFEPDPAAKAWHDRYAETQAALAGALERLAL
jgi:sugar (pentulose or hexulose) kinase